MHIPDAPGAKKPLVLFFAACLCAFMVAACGSSGGGDKATSTPTIVPTATPGGQAGSARVLGVVVSSEVNDQDQASGLVSRVFPAGVDKVYAVVTLQGVEPGMEVTGKWYQLSVADADPNGTEVSSAGVELTNDNVVDGTARVALNVASGNQALPEGDWLIRIYVDDAFLRTAAFVITSQVSFQGDAGAGTSTGSSTGAQLEPTAVPATVIPAPSEYTVKDGDSLNSIANQFKGDNETVEVFLTRLIQLNSLQPETGLVVGQVLKIPPEP
jgi:nucleoid-associated protein YgaU